MGVTCTQSVQVIAIGGGQCAKGGKRMKTIGMIGGMSWESTVLYYQIINETVGKELGGLHSAKILLYSVDFDEIEKYRPAANGRRQGRSYRKRR